MHTNFLQTTRKTWFAIVFALLLVPAFIFGVCSFAENLANPQSSFAEENANFQLEKDSFLAQALTEEEQALVALNSDNAQTIKLYGTLSTNQFQLGQLTPVANSLVYFDGVAPDSSKISKSVITDENGYYEMAIPQYSKGVLYTEKYLSQEENGQLTLNNWYTYLNVRDTVSDFYRDFLYSNILPFYQLYEYFSVVNYVEIGNEISIPAGGVQTSGTLNGSTLPEYTKSVNYKNKILYDVSQSAEKYNDESNSINEELQTQVTLYSTNKSDDTITYTFSIGSDVFSQSVTAIETNPDYVFDGWYKKALIGGKNIKFSDESNEISGMGIPYSAYCKVYSGDYLHDNSEDTFSYASGRKLDEENIESSSSGGIYVYVARFVPKNNFHNITVKVSNEAGENGGYVCGSNGNSGMSESDYLKEFNFNYVSNEEFAPAAYIGGDYLGSNIWAICDGMEEYSSKYELNWIGHNTSSKFLFDGFAFMPLADEHNAFKEWKVYDKDGNIISASSGIISLDQDLTFVACFENTITLTGSVKSNTTNDTIPYASVSFRDKEGNSYQTMTDSEGKFSFEVSKNGGFLTAGKNGYSCETVEVSSGQTTAEVILKEPNNPVYLTGDIFSRDLRLFGNSFERSVAPVGPNILPLTDVTINYYISDEENYTYYVNGLSDNDDSNYEYARSWNNWFEMPIPADSEGWLSFSHEGHQTMSFYLDSQYTHKDSDPTKINVPSLPISDQELYPGEFDPGYDPPAIILATGNNLSVYITTEDPSLGNKILVSNEEGGEPDLVDYHAGKYFRDGDLISIDFLTGTFTLTSPVEGPEEDHVVNCVPVANPDENQEFFGWVAYTNYGERLELMSDSVLHTDLTVYAQFKKAAYLTPKAGGIGHDSYTEEFYSNELKHVGEDEPIVVTQEVPDPLRQYVGTTYSVVGNKIVCAYDESQENPGEIGDIYKETTTLTANAKDGFVFDYWLINGDRVDDVSDVRITEDNLDFDVQAVYKVAEEQASEDVSATAATGDSVPIVLFAILAIAFIAAFATKKITAKF